jgi:uncharacterized protein (TIGR03085 family)
MPQYAVAERHALAETLRRTDPDAGTLCGAWTAAQLAAHLVLRERSLVEAAGHLPVAAFKSRSEQIVERTAAREPYDQLVDLIDAGPAWTDRVGLVPIAWVWSIPAVRETANLVEYVVHHEDVRRAVADWSPRPLPVDVQMQVWKRLGPMAGLMLRSVPLGVALAWPSHGEIRNRRAKQGGPAVTVTGDPVELALFTLGRGAVAQVEFAGSPTDVDAVRSADLSF